MTACVRAAAVAEAGGDKWVQRRLGNSHHFRGKAPRDRQRQQGKGKQEDAGAKTTKGGRCKQPGSEGGVGGGLR